MTRLSGLLVVAALALAALATYDVVRGDRGVADAAPAAAAPAAPPSLELVVSASKLGEVVTSHGLALYRFDKDSAKPAKSTCTGQCATKWPPLLASGDAPQVTGIDPALVGLVVRPDGGRQLTLNGWPLYHYAGDAAPGQLKGEGVGGTWHAISPSGKSASAVKAAGKAKPVPAAPAPAPAAAPEPDAGYGGY